MYFGLPCPTGWKNGLAFRALSEWNSCGLQGDIPSRLQLSRYQTIVWVDGFITASCQTYFVLRLFQLQREHPMTLPLLFGNTSRDFQSCLDGVPFDSFQDLRRNGPVRPQAAERYTPVLAMIDMRSAAMVAWHLAVRAAVSNVKHPSAAPAAQQSC